MTLTGHNKTRTKQMNKSRILQVLLRYGPVSRQQIAEVTGLTAATITNLAAELIEEGLIWEIGNLLGEKQRAGRKSIALDFREDAIWVAGVHIRRDRVELGLVNLKGKVGEYRQYELPPRPEKEMFLQKLKDELAKLIASRKDISVSAIGIGSVGLIDFQNGKIMSAEQMGWHDIDLVGELSGQYQLPIFLDNNVRTMALAEKMFGICKRVGDFIFIYIGQGIGAGLIIQDQIYRRGITGAGEFGHITYQPGGHPCWCGNRGCLERYASNSAILEQLNHTEIENVIRAALQGDDCTLRALRAAGDAIATGLATVINMIHVEKVVIGGSLADEKLPLIQQIRAEIKKRSFLARQEGIKIERSGFGPQLGVIGAGSLALYHSFFDEKSNFSAW